MLHNISKRIKREDKENMLLLQLNINGVTDERILEAFSYVDRNDFVPKQFCRMAYHDMEINIAGTNRVILRPLALAKILSYIIKFDLKSILIIGDISGYTSAIFSSLFDSVTVALVSNSDFDTFSKNFRKTKEVKLINSILSNKKQQFDLVFFDSGFYSFSTVKKTFDIIYNDGMILYFSKKSSFDFSLSKFNFFDANVNCIRNSKIETLFSENVFMAEEFVL